MISISRCSNICGYEPTGLYLSILLISCEYEFSRSVSLHIFTLNSFEAQSYVFCNHCLHFLINTSSLTDVKYIKLKFLWHLPMFHITCFSVPWQPGFICSEPRLICTGLGLSDRNGAHTQLESRHQRRRYICALRIVNSIIEDGWFKAVTLEVLPNWIWFAYFSEHIASVSVPVSIQWIYFHYACNIREAY